MFIGTRVRVKSKVVNGLSYNGQIGTVIANDGKNYTVEYDEAIQRKQGNHTWFEREGKFTGKDLERL